MNSARQFGQVGFGLRNTTSLRHFTWKARASRRTAARRPLGEGEVVEADRAGLVVPCGKEPGWGSMVVGHSTRYGAMPHPDPGLPRCGSARAARRGAREALGARRAVRRWALDARAPCCPPAALTRRCGSEAGSEGATQKCLIGVF